MKVGTKVWMYYFPSTEDDAIPEEIEWPPRADVKRGIVVDDKDPAFKDVERVDHKDQILIRTPCETHPKARTCNCCNNVRSMRPANPPKGPHLYEEDYYGGYYAQVVIVPE